MRVGEANLALRALRALACIARVVRAVPSAPFELRRALFLKRAASFEPIFGIAQQAEYIALVMARLSERHFQPVAPQPLDRANRQRRIGGDALRDRRRG